MKTTKNLGARYFGRATVRALAAKGVVVVDAIAMPGVDGSYIAPDACTMYALSDGRLRTYLDVLAIAA